MAKGGVVGAGIFFLIIAVIGYIYPITDEGWTAPSIDELCSSGWGQLGKAFSGDIQQVCAQYKIITLGIYGSGILGIILIVVGAVVPGGKRESVYTKEVEEIEEEDDSLEILKKRYARGEITKEDFDKMKEDLEK